MHRIDSRNIKGFLNRQITRDNEIFKKIRKLCLFKNSGDYQSTGIMRKTKFHFHHFKMEFNFLL